MRRIVVAALLLCSCDSASDKAKREYDIVREGRHNGADRCKAARKLQDAYLSEGKSDDYHRTKVTADIQCASADLDTMADDTMQPDNLDALPDNTAAP